MIRHLMRGRLAAASQRLIFFADGRRLVVVLRFCSACWQSRHTAAAPTTSVAEGAARYCVPCQLFGQLTST